MGDHMVVGFLLAVLSAFFNGSFPAWSKLQHPGDEADNVVFNGIVGIGAFVSSALVQIVLFIMGHELILSWFAMLGGFLFLGATLCTFIAIPKLGLGAACCVWSVTAIFVSFLWGVLGPQKVQSPVGSWPFALLSLLCLAVGAIVIVLAETLAQQFFGGRPELKLLDVEGQKTAGGTNSGDKVLGLVFAVGVGLFGGSILVPMHFKSEDYDNWQTILSFGLGALIASIFVTQMYWTVIAKKSGIPKVTGRQLLSGLLAGSTWNIGNVCQIAAQSPPIELSYGISYPLLQCGMFFAGILGIYAFGEIQGKAVIVFWIGAVVLSIGVVLLGLSAA